jgi:nitroreductase
VAFLLSIGGDTLALLDLIRKRRSIRRFVDRPVERDKIIKCLEAARLAPSACNAQPWKFIVVDDHDLRERLCQATFSGIYAMTAFAREAPVIVAIISDKRKFLAWAGGLIRGTSYYLIDIGIAGEHFVLQAEELGLGTCWLGWFNEKGLKSALGIPRSQKIDILLAVGYSDDKDGIPAHDREPLEKIFSFNGN